MTMAKIAPILVILMGVLELGAAIGYYMEKDYRTAIYWLLCAGIAAVMYR